MCKNCTFDFSEKEASEFTKSYLKKISDNEHYMSYESQVISAEQKEQGFLEKGVPTVEGIYPFNEYEKFIQKDGKCPGTVHPALWEHAKLNMNAGIFRIYGQDSKKLQKGDVFQVRGYDIFDFKGKKGPYLEDYCFFDEKNENMGIGADARFCKNEYVHFMYECYKKLALDASLVPSSVSDCIEMLETYVNKFRKMDPNKNPSVSFQLEGNDMILWKNLYHPLLVQTNMILDDKFFEPTGDNPHWGIGTYGIFILSELCNVLARCYKLLLVNEFKQLITN